MENEEERKTETAEGTEKVTEAEEGTETPAEGQDVPENDGGNAPEKAKDGEEKKKQTRSQDSYYAKLRRRKEELEAENGRLKAENEGYRSDERKSVTDEALSDLGLSREDLEDPRCMHLAKLYAKASAEGEQNPAAYAYRRQREEDREAQARAEAETKAKADAETAMKERTDAAFRDFTGKYGKDAFRDLTDGNSLFMRKYGNIVTPDNLVALYGIFRDDLKAATEKAKDNGSFDTSSDGDTPARKPKYAEDFPEFN